MPTETSTHDIEPVDVVDRAPADQHPVDEDPVARWWHSRFGAALMWELVIIIPLYQGYRLARRLTKNQFDEALDHAREVISFERAVGLYREADLHGLVLDHPIVIWFVNHYYVYAHFPVMVVALVWLYTFHGSVYPHVRRVLIGTTLVGLLIHIAYPLAPPRLYPGGGFVDTIARWGPEIYKPDRLASVANQIAAMPSLHFGWALIVCWGGMMAVRSRYRFLFLAHPALTFIAIVATANHWWLDAAVAGLIVAVMVGLDARWPSARSAGPLAPAGP
jgi:hypothetical protein